MAPTVNRELSREESSAVDGVRPNLRAPNAGQAVEMATAVDTALRLLRDAVDERKWTHDALGAYLSQVTGKKYDRSIVWRVLNGHRPLSLDFIVALPDDVEACFEAKRAEYFGHIVVEPLEGPSAVKALVAGLCGVMGGLQPHSEMKKASA